MAHIRHRTYSLALTTILDGLRTRAISPLLRTVACTAALVVLGCRVAHAQTDAQLWGNVTFDWIKTDRTTLALNLEPKVLVSAPPGDPGWWSLDVTPSVEYTVRNWLDLTGEVLTAYTKQTNDDNTFELTSRFGLHVSLFSRELPTIVRDRAFKSERPPKRRLVIRDLIRMEQRNLFHSSGGTDSTWRFRNRLEFSFPLNRAKITVDGARYVTSDWEWFIPLGDPQERFASKQRIRAGFGYRRNVRWRYEAPLHLGTIARQHQRVVSHVGQHPQFSREASVLTTFGAAVTAPESRGETYDRPCRTSWMATCSSSVAECFRR